MSATCTKDLEITVGAPLIPLEYWSFDGGSLIGAINGIVLSETLTTVVPGIHNDARQMNPAGVQSTIAVPFPGSPLLAFTSDEYCISQWFKIVVPSDPGNNLQLFTVDFYNSLTSLIGRLRAIILNPDLHAITGPDTSVPYTPDANWHLLIGTFSMATGLLTLRIDNVVVVSTTTPVVIPAGATADWFNLSQLIGTLPVWVIDEVAIFGNRVMTQADYDFLWNGGAGRFWPW